MTTAYNNTLDGDKDFPRVIEEEFNDISDQIRSLQKALANHRQDFNRRLSYLEDLLLLNHGNTTWLDKYDNRCAIRYMRTRKVYGIVCPCFCHKKLNG